MSIAPDPDETPSVRQHPLWFRIFCVVSFVILVIEGVLIWPHMHTPPADVPVVHHHAVHQQHPTKKVGSRNAK